MVNENDFQTIQNFLNQGGTLQALLNINPEDLDYVYSYACQLFDEGDYVGAKKFYILLTRFSHWQYEYWLSLGICYQRLFEHEQAIFCFRQAALLRLNEPTPPYLAGLSYCQLSQPDNALKAFNAALRWCLDTPQHSAIKKESLRQIDAFRQLVAT